MDIEKKDDIIVTVLTLTYNHEPYIRQCLDGIVMQQTNFKFELLIHDDASTDGTANIIREYESKYPDIIKPIYQKENQYSKKVPIGVTYLYPRAKGKYIALCEGDDYWTDPLKLQKQVDFLEANPEYVMCSHRFKQYIQNEHSFIDDGYLNIHSDVVYDLDSLIDGFRYPHTLTVLFRRSALNLNIYCKYAIPIDIILFYHLLQKGKGMMLKDDSAVYRIHNKGVWSGVDLNNHRKIDFSIGLALCGVEQDEKSAMFLKNQFKNAVSRKWMIKEWRTMIEVFKVLTIHLGLFPTLKLYYDKIVLNKLLS